MATKKTTAETAGKKTTARAAAAAADKKAKEAAKAVKETAKAVKETVRSAKEAAEKEAPAKRTRRAAVKSAVYVQFAGKEFTEKALVDAAKEAYVALGNQASDIRTIDVYVKPEESAAYYVVNGEGSDEFKIKL